MTIKTIKEEKKHIIVKKQNKKKCIYGPSTKKFLQLLMPNFSTSYLFSCLHCLCLDCIRYERVTDDQDEPAADRTDGGCVAQYQSTTLRVLTHFVADAGDTRGGAEDDGLEQPNFLLGTDWQVEVTELVKDFLRAEDPNVAQLHDGQILIGMNAGTTKVKVQSSDLTHK